MDALNAVTLLVNGVTLALSLAFLIIVLWNDSSKELNQFFAVFLALVGLWNLGLLLAQTLTLVGANLPLVGVALSLMELGFTGSSVAIYALTAVLVGAHTRRFRLLTFVSLVLVVGYRILLLSSNAPSSFGIDPSGAFNYRAQPLLVLFYLIFDGAALVLLWRFRRRARSRGIVTGIVIFIIGQSLGFLNPALAVFALAVNVCAAGALVLSFAVLRQEILKPLAERNSQVEAIRSVSLAITQHTALETALEQIALQSALLLQADAVGIFLSADDDPDTLLLVTTHQLPRQAIGTRVRLGEGIAGTVAKTRQSMRVENYAREWRGVSELPLAKETFGSLIATPLIYGEAAIGVLVVINGRQGRLFNRDDVYLLESLAVQAAVAIAHSHLFAEQGELTRQVEHARGQLETVLSSTESPVIALDRQLRLIFANPAAKMLSSGAIEGWIVPIPASALPDLRALLRDFRHGRAHTYEVALGDRVYVCHLGRLGQRRIEGYVAVLNDITQLKELDRLKSEMVRMTSHDLKNPLQAAMINLDLLRDELDGDSEVAQTIETINTQLNRMNRIISGILDVERLRFGLRAVELVSPARLAEEAAEEIRDLARRSQVRLITDAPDDLPAVMGDPEQLHRALVNLVENAVKFTPAGGEVRVSAAQDGAEVVFAIADTGIGISETAQAHVFDRFYRANQRGTEHVSGSGLGLSLVKTVVESHHGKVWLASVEGTGTTFYISLPLAAQTAPSS